MGGYIGVDEEDIAESAAQSAHAGRGVSGQTTRAGTRADAEFEFDVEPITAAVDGQRGAVSDRRVPDLREQPATTLNGAVIDREQYIIDGQSTPSGARTWNHLSDSKPGWATIRLICDADEWSIFDRVLVGECIFVAGHDSKSGGIAIVVSHDQQGS